MQPSREDKLTVLIATSDTATRNNLMTVLNEKDYHTVVVDNCKDALEILLEQEFDFTIFDPDIRELSGTEAVEIIRKMRPNLPVIVASDEESYEEGLKIAQTGVYFRIGKPLDADFAKELVKTVKENLTKE